MSIQLTSEFTEADLELDQTDAEALLKIFENHLLHIRSIFSTCQLVICFLLDLDGILEEKKIKKAKNITISKGTILNVRLTFKNSITICSIRTRFFLRQQLKEDEESGKEQDRDKEGR